MDIALDGAQAEALEALYELIRRDQVGAEAYELSGNVIEGINSAEYSAWEWRWRCFVERANAANGANGANATNATNGATVDVDMERALMRRVATANPKNYQLWNHRRKFANYLVGELGKDREGVLTEELEFSESCLQVDTKNYHAWAHRQAVLSELGTEADLERELAFTTSLLHRDVMNNSAWSQRAFLIGSGAAVDWSAEFAATAGWIEGCVENEASWAYLAYVARNAGDEVHGDHADFLCRMLNQHPTSIEAGSAAFEYYKALRNAEKDAAKRAAYADTLKMLRNRLMMIDARRAHRWDVN